MYPRLMTAALALASVITMAPDPADAAPYWPWCSRYFKARDGSITCAFASYEQCMDTVRGIGGYCLKNPYAPPPSRSGKARW